MWGKDIIIISFVERNWPVNCPIRIMDYRRKVVPYVRMEREEKNSLSSR